jgi:hypothetical protein
MILSYILHVVTQDRTPGVVLLKINEVPSWDDYCEDDIVMREMLRVQWPFYTCLLLSLHTCLLLYLYLPTFIS